MSGNEVPQIQHVSDIPQLPRVDTMQHSMYTDIDNEVSGVRGIIAHDAVAAAFMLGGFVKSVKKGAGSAARHLGRSTSS
jgi:hypothetical protein